MSAQKSTAATSPADIEYACRVLRAEGVRIRMNGRIREGNNLDAAADIIEALTAERDAAARGALRAALCVLATGSEASRRVQALMEGDHGKQS